MSNIKPIGDRILVEFKKKEKVGSIILPDRVSKVEDEKAIVIEVGTDPSLVIKKGDEIIFNPHAALVVQLEGTEYILLTEKGIICVTNFFREGR